MYLLHTVCTCNFVKFNTAIKAFKIIMTDEINSYSFAPVQYFFSPALCCSLSLHFIFTALCLNSLINNKA